MEPMNLGSAPSSPASPAVVPSFLPNFLMGESQPSYGAANTMSPGPGQGRISRFTSPATTPISKRIEPPQTFTPHKTGPPSQGLFDTMDQVKKVSSPLTSTRINNETINLQVSRIDDSINYSRHYNEQVDTYWVTVFGYPPHFQNNVLGELKNYGSIVDKRVPDQGNWMHLKFSHPIEVSKALALNGRCITRDVMIGVTLYYPPENKENVSDAGTFSKSYTSPTSPMRVHLRQAPFSPNPSGNESLSVIPPPSVPHKSTGIVSKAMEYVFGW